MQWRYMAKQFFCQSRGRIDKVFAAVENDERWFLLQTIDHDWNDVVRSYRHAERCSHGRRNERSATKSTQVDEVSLAIEGGAHLVGNCHRYRGLAKTARTDDRDKPLLGQLHLDLGQRVAASEHPHQAHGQPDPRGWLEI